MPGRARVDALDLGQQHEQPRPQQNGDLRGQRVVVAEGDLVGRGRVVLVHDRHHAELEQRGQGVARVDVRGALADIRGGEQDLRSGERSERFVPRRLQPRLAERGRGLQSRDAARTAIEAEPRETQRNRSGGDDADRLAGLDHATDLAPARAE